MKRELETPFATCNTCSIRKTMFVIRASVVLLLLAPSSWCQGTDERVCGAKGEKGQKGEACPEEDIRGPKGPRGEKGEPGPRGRPGRDGELEMVSFEERSREDNPSF